MKIKGKNVNINEMWVVTFSDIDKTGELPQTQGVLWGAVLTTEEEALNSIKEAVEHQVESLKKDNILIVHSTIEDWGRFPRIDELERFPCVVESENHKWLFGVQRVHLYIPKN